MMTAARATPLTPIEVERASKRDGKSYELIHGELREKPSGVLALFVASQIAGQLNNQFFPTLGMAAVGAMVYCFDDQNHCRKTGVSYIETKRLSKGRIPPEDLHIIPDLVVEVLSPGNGEIEMEEKLGEYLDARAPLVWIVNPSSRSIRVYRSDGTTHLFRAGDVIQNEPVLPGFAMKVADVFPPLQISGEKLV